MTPAPVLTGLSVSLVCNFMCHEKCLKTLQSGCSCVTPSMVQVKHYTHTDTHLVLCLMNRCCVADDEVNLAVVCLRQWFQISFRLHITTRRAVV